MAVQQNACLRGCRGWVFFGQWCEETRPVRHRFALLHLHGEGIDRCLHSLMVLFYLSGSQSREFTVQYCRTAVSHYRFVVTIHFSHNEVVIYRLFRTYFYTLQSSIGGVRAYLSFYLGQSRQYFEDVAVFDRHAIANYDTSGFYCSN